MSDRIEAALSAAARRADETLAALERWVRTNSYSANVDGVNAVGDLLIADFADCGMAHERHAGEGVGDHHVWKTPRFGLGGTVLIGHHDTVFPPGSFEVFERKGDRLRGPGVLDMKGGLAVIRTALAALSDAGALAESSIAVVCVGDEEIGSPSSRALLEAVANGASAALVFEAGRADDAIITRRKGTGALKVTVSGVAAHAGNHHADGINAIRALARFVDAVENETDYDRGVTVNVGTIAGGEARNTVPHHAECDVDIRFCTADDGRSLIAAINAIASNLSRATGAQFSIDGGIRRNPLERSDASLALCRRYARCAAAAGLDNPEADLIGGGSDASTVSSIGVPAIDGLGPRGKAFHTHDEFIEISSLSPKTAALIRFLGTGSASRITRP